MNKKGFTVVELIVSFAITMIVVAFLFEMIITLKNVYVSSGIKSQLLTKQAIISNKINGDLKNKKIKIVLKCGTGCLNFIFEDNSSTKLIIDQSNNLFTYGKYTTKLIEGSSFGTIDIHNETLVGIPADINDSFITIKVPITNNLLKEDYGLNILYQYDSRTSAISNITFDVSGTTEDRVLLKGSSVMTNPTGTTFVDPGYFVVRNDGSVVDMDTFVTVTGTVGVTAGTTYTLTYTLKDGVGSVLDTKTRNVTVVQSSYTFSYTGSAQTFTVPADGTYQVELWGAQGGGAGAGGKGAYTKGTITLTTNSQFAVMVGETLNAGGGQTGSRITFSGGGKGGGNNALPGGGATDFRLVIGNWNDAVGLKSRIMVAGGGGGIGAGNGAAAGGYAGRVGATGLTGIQPGGGGGTQTFGGALAGDGTVGFFGQGGNGGNGGYYQVDYFYPWPGGGGGGGYYGGGGGAGDGCCGYGGGGGGGSSFISGHPGVNAINAAGVPTGQSNHFSGLVFSNTSLIAGNASMPMPTGGYETGHAGAGYGRITLLSVITTSEVSLTSVETLVVAGGGGGGSGESAAGGDAGGGGGAGGYIYNASLAVSQQTYTVMIGSGGSGAIALSTNGAAGGNSSFATLTAIGGGYGAREDSTGGAGGSGGGGGGSCSTGDHVGGTSTAGQGNIGGTGIQASCNYRGGAGGGGIGGAGANDLITGAGGAGAFGGTNSISGTSVVYAAGGGGGTGRSAGALGGAGGNNIGGAGGSSPSGAGGNAVANTGSGGGGGGAGSPTGGAGSAGIVIIKYLGIQKAAGGTITSVGGYTIHTFAGVGTYAFEVW